MLVASPRSKSDLVIHFSQLSHLTDSYSDIRGQCLGKNEMEVKKYRSHRNFWLPGKWISFEEPWNRLRSDRDLHSSTTRSFYSIYIISTGIFKSSRQVYAIGNSHREKSYTLMSPLERQGKKGQRPIKR
jgi:hypothetical protein